MASTVHRILWKHAIERVVFDPSRPPEIGETIHTYEYWPAEKKTVMYRVEVLDFHISEDKAYQIRLAYRLENNQEFLKSGMSTGVSLIVVPKNKEQAEATFISDPEDEALDGTVKCIVFGEDEARKLEYETVTRIKRQQTEFKKQVLEHGRSCEITGETTEAVLQAAHIVGVKDEGNDSASNGILLRSDLHQLYDAGMFTIQPDGRIHITEPLSEHYTSLLKDARLSTVTLNRIRKSLIRANAGRCQPA